MSLPQSLPDPTAPSSEEMTKEPPLSRPLGWIVLLCLTAVVVFVGLLLNVQGLQISESEQQETRREQLLSTQLSEVAQELMTVQLQAWIVLGTGSTPDRVAFSQQQTQLTQTMARLRAPQEFPELRRRRLEKLPAQTDTYLTQLQSALQCRQDGKIAEATALLQRSRSEGDTLSLTVKMLQENAQDAVRDRQRAIENARISLYAEVILHSVLLCLLLVVTYAVLRAERSYQQKRERQLRRENQHLQQLTEQDGLTGLLNRRAFDDRLRMEWRRARRYGHPLSLLLLDVDYFKNYNKDFGIQVGDNVLRRLAGVLIQSARLTDIVARYGGEEFVILLPHTSSEESRIVGERVRAILAHSDWPHRAVTASIGLATLNEKIKDADALVRAADDALRYAKNHGRDQVIQWDHLPGS